LLSEYLHLLIARALCEIMTGVTSRVSPTVTRVITGGPAVWGVTSLGDYLYVVRYNGNEVEVFDAVTLTLERVLPVPGISFGISGITACSRNNCLYLCVCYYPSIHRVDLTTAAVNSWRTGETPRGLSVNANHNVLVTCAKNKKLQEYKTDGRLMREIYLPAGPQSPWQAVQLSTGHYVVSHWQSPGVLSVVGVDGRLLRSYGSSNSSDVGPMKYPKSLAVTKNGDILVADEGNDRILAVDPSLTRAQVFPLPVDLRLVRPFGLYLDVTRDRLFVGEWGGDLRVIVLDNASCIPWQV